MRLDFNKNFKKQFSKLSPKQTVQVRNCLELFQYEPLHSSLRSHALKGEWQGYHSISAANDLRLHYKLIDSNLAVFVAVGTHSQLYK